MVGYDGEGDLKTGVLVRTQGTMYKAVMQSVFLYKSPSWVVTGSMLKVLEGLHHRVARRIMGMTSRCKKSGEWEWPPVTEALETAVICPIKEYKHLRENTVAAQLGYGPVYELCMGTERIPGTSKFMQWWEQDVGRDVE